jgi:hypothetical protein
MNSERSCPSSTLGNATHLLGVVGPDGRVHYVSPALPIDEQFRSKAESAGDPERRFRLSGPCVESGCTQWTGTRCGVIDSVLDQIPADQDENLKPCTLRKRCRWFTQRGAAACRVCPLVITDDRVVGATGL